MVQLSNASLSVSEVIVSRHDYATSTTSQSQGTCFFWRQDGTPYLITNWHVVTGVNPDNNKILGFIPEQATFVIRRIVVSNTKSRTMRADWVTLDLYSKNQPVWLEHPQGRSVDCVASPLDPSALQNIGNLYLNEIGIAENLAPYAGMDCYIIGYPKGMKGPNLTPVWKRGSVASEPSLDFLGQPMLLVDTATREGMSGSPVLIRHNGVHMPSGKMNDDTVFGLVEGFLGVYSGRIGEDELGVQLGRVWKTNVIDEIIKAQKIGTNPLDE